MFCRAASITVWELLPSGGVLPASSAASAASIAGVVVSTSSAMSFFVLAILPLASSSWLEIYTAVVFSPLKADIKPCIRSTYVVPARPAHSLAACVALFSAVPAASV
jgi:hypothetical protein